MSKGTRKTNIVVRHPFGDPYYPSQKKFFKKVPKYGKKGDGGGSIYFASGMDILQTILRHVLQKFSKKS